MDGIYEETTPWHRVSCLYGQYCTIGISVSIVILQSHQLANKSNNWQCVSGVTAGSILLLVFFS